MEITEKWIKTQIEGLAKEETQFVANANRCAGAIQVMRYTLTRLLSEEAEGDSTGDTPSSPAPLESESPSPGKERENGEQDPRIP